MRLLSVFLSALLAAGPVLGQTAPKPPLPDALKAAAKADPSGRFEDKDLGPLPDDMRKELEKTGWPEHPVTNLDAWMAYERTKRTPFGLNVLGIELGAGHDQIKDDAEPYLRKGAPQLLDWDVRARVALDGLGARAKYRHPEGMRSLSVGFLKYFDLPGVLGAGGARDGVYHALGQTVDKPLGGFEAEVSGAINEHLGGATTYDHREAQKGERYSDKTSAGLTAGYSPLGDNPGKRWNYTLLAGLTHDSEKVRSPGYNADNSGVGWMAGVAFQTALHDLPIPGLQPVPDPSKAIWFDRLKTKVAVSDSAISTVAVDVAAEVSFYVMQHLELTGGLDVTLRPNPNRADTEQKPVGFGAIVGIDLHY
jgi:hypothetical protein